MDETCGAVNSRDSPILFNPAISKFPISADPVSENAREYPNTTHWIATTTYPSIASIMIERAFFERERPNVKRQCLSTGDRQQGS